MREFHFTDPVLRHLDFSAAPAAFFEMPAEEQSMRGRYALMGMLAGHPAERAWYLACDQSPQATADIRKAILSLADDQIENIIEHSVKVPVA